MRMGATVSAVVLCAASVANAQPVRSPDVRLPGRFEVSAGALWVGQASFGTRDAIETSLRGSSFRLFSTASRLGAATAAEMRIGIRLTRLLQGEATGSFAAPVLTTTVSADAENSNGATATDRVEQFTIGGALIVHVTRWHAGARGVPFLMAGAAYLREIHEGHTLIVGGRSYEAGGGVKFALVAAPHGVVKWVGARAEVRARARTKGVALDRRTHVAPVAAASLFVRF